MNGVIADELLADMDNALKTPLEPSTPGTAMSHYKAIVTWMLYFLLVWQTVCHLIMGLSGFYSFCPNFYILSGYSQLMLLVLQVIFV